MQRKEDLIDVRERAHEAQKTGRSDAEHALPVEMPITDPGRELSLKRKLPSPRLTLTIGCKCPDFKTTNTHSKLKDEFARLYPRLEVGEISCFRSLRWKNVPCEVRGVWEGVPQDMEDEYEDTVQPLVHDVLGDHFLSIYSVFAELS